jgi:UDP-2,3-diacylglucosamine pyrophosphatase LpxH
MSASLNLNGFENLYIVSDLHMGDGSQKDNFEPFKKAFEDFLHEEVFVSGGNRLILAGDIFEFWQSFHSTIIKQNYDILRTLVDNGAIFVVGNHDIDLIDFVGSAINLKFFDLLAHDLQFKVSGKKFFVCHGHEFDKYNDPGRHLVWGRICALFASWVEMEVGRKIGGTLTEEWLMSGAMQIVRLAKWIMGKYFKTPSQQKKPEKIVPEYIAEARKVKESRGLDFVISGHTHLVGFYQEWYLNSGSWQNTPLTYVKISKEAECRIFEWPTKRLVDKDLSKIKGM